MKASPIPLLFVVLTSAIATAQQAPTGQRPPPPPPLLALFDADHDGVLSAAEISQAAAALAKLDQNADGQLTGDEMRPPRPEGKNPGEAPQGPPPQGHRPPPPVIAALDADHNGTISAAELANAPEALKPFDTDGDGELSPQELMPPPPPRDDAGGAEGPPDGPPPPADAPEAQ